MAWVQPEAPNLADFFTYAYAQGIPSADLPLPTLSVTDGGSGYLAAPAVTIDPPTDGLAMTATATITGGVVTALTVVYPGTNYASLPALTIAAAPVGGTSATGTVATLGSAYPAGAFARALDLTIDSTGAALLKGELTEYAQAVYNLGVHFLLQFAQDVAGQTFFATQRVNYGLNRFRPGVVMASGDQGTSQTFVVPKFIQEITLGPLEATRTPWGRSWIAYQQMYGQTVWDMS